MAVRFSGVARALVLAASLFSGCSAPSATTPQAGFLPVNSVIRPDTSSPAGYIKHVVIVIQENRSFDNLFAGFPGANTLMYGYLHDGTKVALQPIPFEVHDMDHNFSTGIMDWDNGKMDRFDLNGTSAGQTIGAFAYSYLERTAVAPYWALARQYVLADHMFPTMFGPSYTAHLTLISGNADLSPTESEADVPSAQPWGCDAPAGTTSATVNEERVVSGGGPFPCFTQFRTLADTLDAANVSWKYYAPVVGGTVLGGNIWSAFDSIKNVRYSQRWKNNVISPPQRILTDAAHGRLASVSWVVPDFDWSDHPYAGTPYGPSWIAAIVNAVGKSSDWNSTAIVVVWDDWGGFYDNVPPPQRDFRGLGIRVGCLIISPYVKPHVEHRTYEFGSIVRFVEEAFNLDSLGTISEGYTDTRAASLRDAFNFKRKPRSFKTIPAPYPPSFFMGHAASMQAPDSD